MPLFEYMTDLMGLPYPSSHLPSIIMPADYSDRDMGYFTRLWNFFAVEFARKTFAETLPDYNGIFRKHYG
jgi:hypothetical protein